ncbi:MAG: hypothetical protein MUP47_01235 [Phycisphaerae bacterium]|nr:hypothetical protein [Phycisphaerae bacterium]
MKTTRTLIAVAAGVVAATALAPGQAVDTGAMAAPALSAGAPWIAILVSLVAAVAICVVGFKSSHRTHLD